MAGGCMSCFLTCISLLLLLGVCLHDVETSSCENKIHKQVGDTVEMSSGLLTTEGVDSAQWKYGESIIAKRNRIISGKPQFEGRLEVNPTSFNLTVRGLTLKDSGDFTFISEVTGTQRETVPITLQVHEPITKQPVLTSNSIWDTGNESCTVFLECSATTGSNVTYNWAVRNKTRSGSRLQYIITPQDGDTRFTCTIFNCIGEKSAIKIVKCTQASGQNFLILLGAAGGGCLMIVVIVGVAVYVYHCKESPAGSESNDLTVYADIADVAIFNRTSSTMKPCTLYETIENRVDTVPPQPQTVYDMIQFSRMRETSMSPYQENS